MVNAQTLEYLRSFPDKHQDLLSARVRDLGTKISDISIQRDDWIVHFQWRKCRERDLLCWVVVREWFLENSTGVARLVLEEIDSLFLQQKKRTEGKLSVLISYAGSEQKAILLRFKPELLIHPRALQGNFLNEKTLKEMLSLFKVTIPRRRKVRKPQRIRGYRDKGSSVSISVSARRNANQEWSQYHRELRALVLRMGSKAKRWLRERIKEMRGP